MALIVVVAALSLRGSAGCASLEVLSSRFGEARWTAGTFQLCEWTDGKDHSARAILFQGPERWQDSGTPRAGSVVVLAKYETGEN